MDIIALLESRFGSNYIYEVLEYNEIKSLSMVRVICKKHNNVEEGLVINLLHKKIPCGICEEEDGGNIEGEKVEKLNRKKYQLAELIEKFESIHGNRFLYHDLAYFYVNMKTPCWFKCVKHNHFFKQTPSNHITGKICCPKCLEELVNS